MQGRQFAARWPAPSPHPRQVAAGVQCLLPASRPHRFISIQQATPGTAPSLAQPKQRRPQTGRDAAHTSNSGLQRTQKTQHARVTGRRRRSEEEDDESLRDGWRLDFAASRFRVGRRRPFAPSEWAASSVAASDSRSPLQRPPTSVPPNTQPCADYFHMLHLCCRACDVPCSPSGLQAYMVESSASLHDALLLSRAAVGVFLANSVV